MYAVSIPPERLKVQAAYTSPVDTFGTRLRTARESVGLSQDDAALELGVSKSSLSAWENDKHFPQLETFIQLCALYRASADEIISASRGVHERGSSYAPLSPEHLRVVEILGNLPQRQRRLVAAFLEEFLERKREAD